MKNKENIPIITLENTLEEDFSYETLRQRALAKIVLCTKDGSTTTTTDSKKRPDDDIAKQEDFSFSKLKERAANPNKSNHNPPQKKQVQSQSLIQTTTTTTASRTHPVPMPHTPPTKKHNHTPHKTINSTNHNTCSASKPTTPYDPKKYLFGPKIRKEEVQATDESHASVQKLSQWLSHDPFDTKKPIVIRKGVQIANKARVFERGPTLEELLDASANGMRSSNSSGGSGPKLLTRVQREQEYFRKGGVSQGKEWLKHAFGNPTSCEKEEGKNPTLEEESLGVQEKKRLFEQGIVFQKKKKMKKNDSNNNNNNNEP